MWFISLFFFCLWFFSFMHAGSFPAVAARSRADWCHLFDLLSCDSFACHCTSTLALSLLPAIARSSVFLSCWGSCLPAFPPDVPPFRLLWKPVPSSVQWVLPVLPRTASYLVHLHPVNSSGLLPAASFPWALQAGFLAVCHRLCLLCWQTVFHKVLDIFLLDFVMDTFCFTCMIVFL